MKPIFHKTILPFYRITKSNSFKYLQQTIFARNLYVKIAVAVIIFFLIIIWLTSLKIFFGAYPIITPQFIKNQVPEIIRPHILPSILTIIVFLNLGLLAAAYKKYPGIIYIIITVTGYLELIIFATIVYYLIKF